MIDNEIAQGPNRVNGPGPEDDVRLDDGYIGFNTAPANGIELCYETFGDRSNPPLLLVMRRQELGKVARLVEVAEGLGESVGAQPRQGRGVVDPGHAEGRAHGANPAGSGQPADRIAINLGFANDAAPRLDAGLIYALETLQEEGHTAFPRDELVTYTATLLETSAERVEARIDAKLKKILSVPKAPPPAESITLRVAEILLIG